MLKSTHVETDTNSNAQIRMKFLSEGVKGSGIFEYLLYIRDYNWNFTHYFVK